MRGLPYLDPCRDRGFRVVFLTGVYGSGTSLLQSLLDQRYELAASVRTTYRMPAGSGLAMEAVEAHASLSDYRARLAIPEALDDETVRVLYSDLYRESIHRRAILHRRTPRTVIDKSAILHQVRAARLKAAFPEASFVLIFREPVEIIEGLRRKWQLYRRADLAELCGFWESLHRDFIRDTAPFTSDVVGIAYDRLVRAVDPSLAAIARFCDLKPRAQPRKLEDRPNVRGKGVRNVVDGIVRVVRDQATPADHLTDDEKQLIATRLAPVYDELVDYYGAGEPRDGFAPR